MLEVINMFGLLKQSVSNFINSIELSLDGIAIDIKEKHYETYVAIDSSQDKMEEFGKLKQSIFEKFNKNIYGVNEQNIYCCAFDLLKKMNKKLALAESVTAGRLSSEFVANNEGASNILVEGVVCYSIKSKCARFGIEPGFFEINSPQSFETSKALAYSLIRQNEVDVAIAVTGYASSISKDAENGDAYVAIALKSGIYTQRVHFNGTRNHIMQQIAKFAFMFMIKLLNQ